MVLNPDVQPGWNSTGKKIKARRSNQTQSTVPSDADYDDMLVIEPSAKQMLLTTRTLLISI